jgi:UrcA family protein
MNGIKTTLLIFGLAITLPGVAFAERPGSSNYNLVYTEADFSSAASVQELHAKIVRTARSHCPSYFSTRSLADTRSCVRDVVTNLVRVINRPQLTAYAQSNGVMKLAADLDGSDAQS